MELIMAINQALVAELKKAYAEYCKTNGKKNCECEEHKAIEAYIRKAYYYCKGDDKIMAEVEADIADGFFKSLVDGFEFEYPCRRYCDDYIVDTSVEDYYDNDIYPRWEK